MKTTVVVAILSMTLEAGIVANVVAAVDAPIYQYTVQGTFDTTSFGILAMCARRRASVSCT